LPKKIRRQVVKMQSVGFVSIATLILVWALAWIPAGARAQSLAGASVNAPRTQDGQLDIQGYWSNTPESRGTGIVDDLEGLRSESSPIPKAVAKKSSIVDPADGKIPYQPWAEAVREENWKNAFNPTEPEQIDSLSRCFEIGVPRASFFPGVGGTLTFQILQPPGYVVMVYDLPSGASRVIPLDGRPHIGGTVKLWSGDSVGHWEGNSLVVDVTNINEHAWYDCCGNFHSDQLHLVERWTVLGPDRIDYEVTNYDPKVFTRPFTVKFAYARKANAPEQWENSCFEYEMDVDAMLKRNKSGGSDSK
jgi:hypothetical protein